MLVSLVCIVLGVALLVGGGEYLVKGASSIGLRARLSPTVVGLTIVSAGTSMPELVVSLHAAFSGSAALAIGNAVGSNIFNVSMILGIAAMIAPLRIAGNTVRLEWPVMMLSAFQLHLLARDGRIDRLEGGFLVTALVAFLAYVVSITSRSAGESEHAEYESTVKTKERTPGYRMWLVYGGQVVAGALLLVAGAHFLVDGAVDIAESFGISKAIIGLTVVAAGTSLPELAASAVAAFRGKNDLAVGNIVGSNIFNVLCIVGMTAVVHPLQVPMEVVVRDNWWMIGLSALLLPVMRSSMRISRIEGFLLLAIFGAYMTVLVT